MTINMTPEPEIINFESRAYMYLQKFGPFMKTAPGAWQEFWGICGQLLGMLSIDKMAGLSRIDESKTDDSKFIYQAGVFLKSKPNNVPSKVLIRDTKAGKYAKFLLTGSYQQLAQAYPEAYEIIKRKNLKLRDEFCAEIYLNTPQDTAEADLKTEILIPIQ